LAEVISQNETLQLQVRKAEQNNKVWPCLETELNWHGHWELLVTLFLWSQFSIYDLWGSNLPWEYSSFGSSQRLKALESFWLYSTTEFMSSMTGR
jgi:hypothetical protein